MDWQFRLPPAGSGIVMRHFDSRRDRRTLGMADSNNMSMQFGNDTAGCAKNSLPNNHPPTSSIQFFHTLHSSFPQNASSHKSLDKTATAFVGHSFREITTGVGSDTQMPNNFKNQHHPELKREKQGSQGKRKQDVDGKEEGKPIHLELRAREYSFYQ